MENLLYLYLKESPPGLKYLGVTTKNPFKYRGSGIYWKAHLKAHNIGYKEIKTTILYQDNNKEVIKEMGLFYSNLFDIVKSKEWANLIVESCDGVLNYNHLEETKEKIRKTLKNRIFTEEHKKRLSIANTGRKLSEEHKLAVSRGLNKRFSISPKKGTKHSQETKDKISKSKKGQKAGEDTKNKLSEILKLAYKNGTRAMSIKHKEKVSDIKSKEITVEFIDSKEIKKYKNYNSFFNEIKIPRTTLYRYMNKDKIFEGLNIKITNKQIL